LFKIGTILFIAVEIACTHGAFESKNDSFAKSFDYFSILPVNVRLPVVNIFNVDFISGNVNVAPGCNSGS
jgi:hypothetical protein